MFWQLCRRQQQGRRPGLLACLPPRLPGALLASPCLPGQHAPPGQPATVLRACLGPLPPVRRYQKIKMQQIKQDSHGGHLLAAAVGKGGDGKNGSPGLPRYAVPAVELAADAVGSKVPDKV